MVPRPRLEFMKDMTAIPALWPNSEVKGKHGTLNRAHTPNHGQYDAGDQTANHYSKLE